MNLRHLPVRRRAVGTFALALAAVATTTVGITTAAAESPTALVAHSATRSSQVTKPTVVLVHGAFADASGFSAEIAQLQADGYPVIAPANPLRGLTADSDYIRSVLATIDGPVVLVGHSYGGAVITNAARGASDVKALVYLAAFIPDENDSVATAYDPVTYPGALLDQSALVVRATYNPAAESQGGQDADLYIRPDRFRAVFAGDQSKRTAAVMAATQRPLSAYAFTEPSGAPAWEAIPSWDLLTLEDRAISPGGQRFMAERAGARIHTVHSAHDVMVSHPRRVVNLIERAADHVS